MSYKSGSSEKTVSLSAGYQPISQINMDDFYKDENKFVQLPWEDAMYSIYFILFFMFC